MKKITNEIQDLITQGTFPRNYRLNQTPASINPALAYVMNQLAELDKNDRLLDPCCGTATILIERQQLMPCLSIGVDIDPKVLTQAQENIKTASLRGRNEMTDAAISNNTAGSIELKHGDIQDQKFPNGYFTKIISNLPYGLHSGSRQKNIQLYRFLAEASQIWLKKNGKIVLLTSAGNLLWNAFANKPQLKFIDKIAIPNDPLTRHIYIYQKI